MQCSAPALLSSLCIITHLVTSDWAGKSDKKTCNMIQGLVPRDLPQIIISTMKLRGIDIRYKIDLAFVRFHRILQWQEAR
jgi:hypothetical protein